ncbi:MAG: DUF2726 domain-containing protein [Burkholderiaceae bacterium]|nr:DUF2726 domain-containing protein [Burkholderiaceae bacterium]
MIAIGVAGAVLGGLVAWAWRSPRDPVQPLPTSWAISPRPVFNASERRLYRQLKDAFPQHVVMPKLPLVRLCQPDDRNQVDYWYDLLGSTHATFTICSSNGKALLAIDLESRRARPKRNLEIKEAVLNACQIKYFSLAADGMPTIAALRLLLPTQEAETTPALSKHAAAALPTASAGDPRAASEGVRPTEAAGRWHDPNVFTQDSFFAPDSRLDAENDTEARPTPADAQTDADRHSDLGGVVVDDDGLLAPEPSSASGAGVR